MRFLYPLLRETVAHRERTEAQVTTVLYKLIGQHSIGYCRVGNRGACIGGIQSLCHCQILITAYLIAFISIAIVWNKITGRIKHRVALPVSVSVACQQVAVVGGRTNHRIVQCRHVHHIIANRVSEVGCQIYLTPFVATNMETYIETAVHHRHRIANLHHIISINHAVFIGINYLHHTGICFSQRSTYFITIRIIPTIFSGSTCFVERSKIACRVPAVRLITPHITYH